MAVSTLKAALDRAFAERYGVPAISVVTDVTTDAVLAVLTHSVGPEVAARFRVDCWFGWKGRR